MPDPLRLLDGHVGIENVLSSLETPNMPEARPLPSTALREAGLEELFGATNTEKMLEQARVRRLVTALCCSRQSSAMRSKTVWKC